MGGGPRPGLYGVLHPAGPASLGAVPFKTGQCATGWIAASLGDIWGQRVQHLWRRSPSRLGSVLPAGRSLVDVGGICGQRVLHFGSSSPWLLWLHLSYAGGAFGIGHLAGGRILSGFRATSLFWVIAASAVCLLAYFLLLCPAAGGICKAGLWSTICCGWHLQGWRSGAPSLPLWVVSERREFSWQSAADGHLRGRSSGLRVKRVAAAVASTYWPVRGISVAVLRRLGSFGVWAYAPSSTSTLRVAYKESLSRIPVEFFVNEGRDVRQALRRRRFWSHY